jgi:hypothetical protein
MATTITKDNPFMLAREAEGAAKPEKDEVFRYGTNKRVICVTEEAGQPKNLDVHRNEIRVGLGELIPLWASDVTLYWRFNARSFRAFAHPQAAKERVRNLLSQALGRWEDARPINFVERPRGWDFEVVVRNAPDCDASGCVLASSFFPDAGRHKLLIYPTMFDQEEEEQIETLIHEIGHVFGLRHFFANVSETQLKSELFGTDAEFTIMNYGKKSVLTEQDRADVKKLYQLARSGELRAINGTPIKLMRPFSSLGL